MPEENGIEIADGAAGIGSIKNVSGHDGERELVRIIRGFAEKAAPV